MKTLIPLLFLQLLIVTASSQTKSYLSGKIVNEQMSPIAKATIHLLNSNAGAITDERGNFKLKNLFPGIYEMEVTAIGYVGISKTITIHQGSNDIEFKLIQTTKQLSEVIVTAQKEEEDLQKFLLVLLLFPESR